jgi:hypothetical protein
MRSDLWGEANRVDRESLPTLYEMISDQLSLEKPVTTQAAEVENLRKTL